MFDVDMTSMRRRVKWASFGAAVGAGAGAVVNPRYAGAGGAFGGTMGALLANASCTVESRVEGVSGCVKSRVEQRELARN